MEKQVLSNFYTFCLSSCNQRRLKKIEWIIKSSRNILKKDLTRLNIEDVVKFLAYINQSDFKEWTKNDYKKIFKRFLKWHYKDLDMIEGEKVKLGFRVSSKKRCMNKEKINKNTLVKPEELEKLIRTAKSLKWKAIVSFAYESAFRPCEIRSLKWKDLKFDDSLNICRVNLVISPKTQEGREIPVRDCVVHLKRWKDEYSFPNRTDNDLVFPSQHERDVPMGDGVMSEMFKRLCIDAKMRHIFPYLLRHSRIYELQKRLPEKIASKFAGHSVETSELYNHLADDDVEESMLKEIYTTKELTPNEREQLEDVFKELKVLRSKVNKFETEHQLTKKLNDALEMVKKSQKEGEKKMVKIQHLLKEDKKNYG